MALGLSTIGIKFGYASAQAGPFTQLPGLQEVPSMLGKPSKVDVTTLADTVKKYVFGVKDLGDLQFKFVYDQATFTTIKGLVGSTAYWFQVEFPDDPTPGSGNGTRFTFQAYVNIETDSAQIDKALGMTMTLALQSDITITAAS